ncbi:Protein of unknown function [Cotesia congregata]|uniref:Uncharacterized protein n=1 Tax=Cotesia congregata TaxID=51543 RepID=A0A8J2H824_COTCN|nr:Protein of unknown function [Cotesia congregata]
MEAAVGTFGTINRSASFFIYEVSLSGTRIGGWLFRIVTIGLYSLLFDNPLLPFSAPTSTLSGISSSGLPSATTSLEAPKIASAATYGKMKLSSEG